MDRGAVGCPAWWSGGARTAISRPPLTRANSGSRFREPIPNSVTDQIDNRFDPNLSHQCSAVRLDGLNADTEILGDLFIPMPLRQQLHDLTLARGQPRRRCCNTRLAARAQKTLEDRLRNLRA